VFTLASAWKRGTVNDRNEDNEKGKRSQDLRYFACRDLRCRVFGSGFWVKGNIRVNGTKLHVQSLGFGI
jgi:hypothetical protein